MELCYIVHVCANQPKMSLLFAGPSKIGHRKPWCGFFSINKHGEFCGAWLGNPLAMEIDICQISELLLNFQKWS